MTALTRLRAVDTLTRIHIAAAAGNEGGALRSRIAVHPDDWEMLKVLYAGLADATPGATATIDGIDIVVSDAAFRGQPGPLEMPPDQ